MSQQNTQDSTTKRQQILLVDDEKSSLEYLKACLRKANCTYDTANNVKEAQEIINREGPGHFDCLITDYHMPEHTGIELLEWIQEIDETLCTVIITAQDEKQIVTETLRKGASDYLEKPVPPKLLKIVVNRLCDQTKQQRSLRNSHKAVSELSLLQAHFCRSKRIHGVQPLELFFLPQHELGGDFLDVVPISPTCFAISCADVSGHDLKAAYISSYFQGMARGMLQEGTALTDVIASINDIMIAEWNDVQIRNTHRSSFSLAAAFALVNMEEDTIEVYNCGFPSPLLIDVYGNTISLDEGSQPLGWFKDGVFSHRSYVLSSLKYIFMHTDGHTDLAETLKVHPLSLAHRLLNIKSSREQSEVTAQANDDILFAKINLTNHSYGYFPLIDQKLTKHEINSIDTIQDHWKRSLQFALPPEIIDTRLNDILVCCREIALNALEHGCSHSKDSFCAFNIAYQATDQILSVWADDHGQGFDFDMEERIDEIEQLKVNNSHIGLGLVLVYGIADDIITMRNGSCICLKFKLGEPIND